MTRDEWLAEGRRLFGDDVLQWWFVCPSCGHVASVQDWKDAGAPEGAVAFSCVGRYTGAGGEKTFAKKGGPCDYAGGGLIGLNPVEVDGTRVFAFATPDMSSREQKIAA